MNAMAGANKQTPYCQTGAALTVSLLFLLIMTLTGIAAMQIATLEEKMSGNLRDRNLAFQAAESALRAGEAALQQALDAKPVTASFGCSGPFACALAGDLSADSSVWNSVNAVAYTGILANLAGSPKYILEVLTPDPLANSFVAGAAVTGGQCYYRITARGVGSSAATTVVLQSTYAHVAVYKDPRGEQCNGL